MRYVLVDNKDGDLFTKEFDSIEPAIEEFISEWEKLTTHDKKRRIDFYILKSDNPDEDAVNHLDGEIIKSFK